uniref:Uncharacterized protein n=1 Tax=Brassica campestris TaxID=3711 RepID=A0A3P6DJ55_BRACM|nr:unnamed protein product [Brassica rapa]
MDNQSIFKYSWETLPKKWVKKKMERSEHGNRSDTNTDYLFQLLCFLKLHTYIQGFKFRSIFAELIIPPENEDLKWSIIY